DDNPVEQEFLTEVVDILAKDIERKNLLLKNPNMSPDQLKGQIPESYSTAFKDRQTGKVNQYAQDKFRQLILNDYLATDVHSPDEGDAVLKEAFDFWKNNANTDSKPFHEAYEAVLT